MKNQLFQRRILAILSGLMAPSCIFFGIFARGQNLPNWYASISSTYYANHKIFFIGILFATAVFYFSYKGYDWKDRVLTIVQGIGVVGIILFPCYTEGAPAYVGLFSLPIKISHIIHCCFTALYFFGFGFHITFLFPLSNGNMTSQKKKRNRIYRVCGIIIFTFMIIQAFTSTIFRPFFGNFPTTWFNEFIMLSAFCLAWLVKGEAFTFLNDIETDNE